MAVAELTEAPLTEAQIAFMSNARRYRDQDVVCAVVSVPEGWYADLILFE